MAKTLSHMFILLISCLPTILHAEKLLDSVENISDYTDINMLLAVQLLTPKTDSKTFVDRPTNKPLEEVKKAFVKIEGKLGLKRGSTFSLSERRKTYIENVNALIGPNKVKIANLKQLRKNNKDKVAILTKFLSENFLEIGSDLKEHSPEDHIDSPEFLNFITNEELIKVSKALNDKWKSLSREKIHFNKGESSTLLDLPHPFIIPGGRFREYYYWDTYWILEGLLICDMDHSAENIIKNFIHIIKTYGYIPNGLRKYYLYRSQQPYFPMMLLKMYNYKGGIYNDLVLGEGLNMATREYEFFENYRSKSVKGRDGAFHKLNLFHVSTDFPRPESFGEDIITFKNQSELNENQVFSNLKSGAESGWDFSSRWLLDPTDLKTIAAYDQIPADLNAVIFRNEKILEKLWRDKGDDIKAEEFKEKSRAREIAINQVLWNESEKTWMDFNLVAGKHVAHRFYFSNLEPMIYGIKPPGKTSVYDILKKYSKEVFGYPGGIPASGEGPATKEQWDYPNVWAPHQHMIVDYLLSIGEKEMALHIAKSFVTSVGIGYKNDKDFYEKYDCNKPGFTGAGGEYAPQTGFGWTNGTTLSFIHEFGDDIMNGTSHKESYENILKVLETRGREVAPIPIGSMQTEKLPPRMLEISVK